MRPIRQIYCLALLAFALVVGGTGCGWQSPMSGNLTAVTNFTRIAAVPAGLTRLVVENTLGQVRIRGVTNGPLAWTWKAAVRGTNLDSARRIAEAVQCSTNFEGGCLRIAVSIPPMDAPHQLQSDFEITVPASASVSARTSFDRLEISGVAAVDQAVDQNGGVEIRDIAGPLKAKTSFASLTVNATGAANLENQNGEVDATQIRGPLNVRTSFAAVLAQNVEGAATVENQNGEVKANAIHGPLTVTTSFAPINAFDIGGPAKLRNQNGAVEAAKVRGDVDIRTSFDGLSVNEIQGDAALENQNGGIFANTVSGKLRASTSFAEMDVKGAGPEFICHNQNGAVRVHATSGKITRVEAETSFSPLEVSLPENSHPSLTAETSFDKVDSDFPLAAPGTAPAAAPGLCRVSLRNQNGPIRVRRD